MNQETLTTTKKSNWIIRWLKRAVMVLLVLIALAVLGMMAYESISETTTRRIYPPPGEMIDTDGYRLHLHITGEDRGLPTVILEHGGAALSSQWGWVQPELARHTRVVAYDRPGLGWSEAAPADLDAETAVHHLYAVLQQEGVEGPYVLVGHSMGALMTRVFAQLYPNEVVGLVLVDPRNVAQHELLSFGMEESALRMAQLASRLGILRLSGMAERETAALPSPQREEASRIYLSHRQVSGWAADDSLANSAITFLQQNESVTLPPLIVLDATTPGEGFDAAQRRVLTEQFHAIVDRSIAGVYRALDGASHGSIVMDPRYAQIVSDSVLEMLE